MAIEKIEKLIASLDWAFAKTMPEIPHEYIVVDDYPEKSEIIDRFINLIDKKGYTEIFRGKKYKYLNLGYYKYWVIDGIINREKIK